MAKEMFKVTFMTGKYGHTFPVITDQQYPYANLQVVPLNDGNREEMLQQLQQDCGGYRMADGHDEFAVILAGGTSDEHPPLVINQENHSEVDRALQESMQRGADWWAAHGREWIEAKKK